MKKLFDLLKGFKRNLIEFFAWFFRLISPFKPQWNRFIKFVSNWNEVLTIPLGFALFYFFPMLLRMIDPVAGGYDIGILHAAIAAISIMLIIHGFTWLLLKLTFPNVYYFLDTILDDLFKFDSTLNTLQKCVISLSIFSLYLFGTILLVRMF